MQTPEPSLPLRPILWRGWRRRCPKCGNGAMMRSYLKVSDACPVCEEPLHLHKADDGPAYLTILIVGHIMAPIMHIWFTQFRPDPWVFATGLCIIAVAISLYLLPRLKGVIVAFQWARGLGDFPNPVGTQPPKAPPSPAPKTS